MDRQTEQQRTTQYALSNIKGVQTQGKNKPCENKIMIQQEAKSKGEVKGQRWGMLHILIGFLKGGTEKWGCRVGAKFPRASIWGYCILLDYFTRECRDP